MAPRHFLPQIEILKAYISRIANSTTSGLIIYKVECWILLKNNFGEHCISTNVLIKPAVGLRREIEIV